MRASRRRLESGCQRGWAGATPSGGASWNAPLQRSCAAGRMGLNGAGGAGLLTTAGWNHGVRGWDCSIWWERRGGVTRSGRGWGRALVCHEVENMLGARLGRPATHGCVRTVVSALAAPARSCRATLSTVEGRGLPA